MKGKKGRGKELDKWKGKEWEARVSSGSPRGRGRPRAVSATPRADAATWRPRAGSAGRAAEWGDRALLVRGLRSAVASSAGPVRQDRDIWGCLRAGGRVQKALGCSVWGKGIVTAQKQTQTGRRGSKRLSKVVSGPSSSGGIQFIRLLCEFSGPQVHTSILFECTCLSVHANFFIFEVV